MLRAGTQDRFIQNRVNMPTEKSHAELVSGVASQIKARAFFSARVAEAHILDRLRDVSDRYSRGEMGLGEARNILKDFLRGEGLDPHQAGMRNLASTARLNLILRQNAAMAKAAGEWKRMHDPDQLAVFPYVRYHSRNDGRTRGSHDALDGKIFDKNDPFLKTHTPPWEFNCRCWLEEITAKEAGGNVEPLTKPEDVRVESESGFVFDPEEGLGTFSFDSIKDPKLRADAQTGVTKILAEESQTGRTSQTSQTKPAETHEQHAARRQEQWNAAYQKRLSTWQEAMKKSNVPDDIAVEMANFYSPQMAKFGKPPKMTVSNGRGFFSPIKNEIVFDSNNGHPLDTCRHEFGHWVDFHTRLKPPITTGNIEVKCAEFNAACAADWKKLKAMAKKKYPCGIRAFSQYVSIDPAHPNWSEGDYFEDVSQRLFGKSYKQLDTEEWYVVGGYMDSIGSITQARHGGGHTKKEYTPWNTEHFANAVAMWTRGDAVFKLDFPETWKYINAIMKKGEWK